jgi:hypothetical protein
MLQAGISRVRAQWGHRIFFSIYLILPAPLSPGVYSASNRIGYQKQKHIFWAVKHGRSMRLELLLREWNGRGVKLANHQLVPSSSIHGSTNSLLRTSLWIGETAFSIIDAVWFWVELILWPTVSRPISHRFGHPFGANDQIFLFPIFFRTIALLFVLGRPIWREDGSVICSAICQWWESPRTLNHTLLSHLRLLGSLSVASYDSQGLRWKYSYPPPRREVWF